MVQPSRQTQKTLDPDRRLQPELSENVGCRHPRSKSRRRLSRGKAHFGYIQSPSYHLYIHNSIQHHPSAHHQQWQAPNDPQRHPARQRPTQPSRPNKYGAWKKPACEPKHYASKTNNSNHPVPQHALKMAKPHPKSQAKNDQHPPPSHQPSETPAATQAMAHQPLPTQTPPSAPRANSKNTSNTTSAK